MVQNEFSSVRIKVVQGHPGQHLWRRDNVCSHQRWGHLAEFWWWWWGTYILFIVRYLAEQKHTLRYICAKAVLPFPLWENSRTSGRVLFRKELQLEGAVIIGGIVTWCSIPGTAQGLPAAIGQLRRSMGVLLHVFPCLGLLPMKEIYSKK